MMSNKKLVAELEGAELDYWVAKAQGWYIEKSVGDDHIDVWCDDNRSEYGLNPVSTYQPSTNWEQGGPIIEREIIALDPRIDNDDKLLLVHAYGGGNGSGNTYLIAAMRCYVASKYGAFVEVEQ
ncbi:MAG: DUF2591 domain-containing protein [Methylobacter sp.]|nr:DUF2591 domain-containing protein [Methylobacter sp.]